MFSNRVLTSQSDPINIPVCVCTSLEAPLLFTKWTQLVVEGSNMRESECKNLSETDFPRTYWSCLTVRSLRYQHNIFNKCRSMPRKNTGIHGGEHARGSGKNDVLYWDITSIYHNTGHLQAMTKSLLLLRHLLFSSFSWLEVIPIVIQRRSSGSRRLGTIGVKLFGDLRIKVKTHYGFKWV